jgi:O-acetyl-ADP-ribose deacetylase (regulator of RNase III)
MSTRPPPNAEAETEADEETESTPSQPKNLIYKSGDLLTAKEEYIIHQCNCTSSTAAGLAQAITTKFPYAAPYTHRRPNPAHRSRCLPEDASKPGTIQVWRSPSADSPHFIGLYAQQGPGKPYGVDSRSAREEWFRYCLGLIEKISEVKSVAFPWQIGCGLAGGDWRVYEGMIWEWAENHPDISIVVYKLEDVGHQGREARGRGGGSRGGRGRR